MSDLTEVFGAPISVYTRAQAIADGALVDLSEWAGPREMMNGFTIPVAVTAAVWAEIQAIPKSQAGCQDVRGRAHDVLWMARCAARSGSADGGDDSSVLFEVILSVAGERQATRTYRLVCGPGDAGEPVLTIMLPGED